MSGAVFPHVVLLGNPLERDLQVLINGVPVHTAEDREVVVEMGADRLTTVTLTLVVGSLELSLDGP